MQVTNGSKKFSIGWFYSNPELDILLDAAGITPAAARAMKKSELAQALGLSQLPLPTQTECIIRDEEGVEIADAEVIKHVGDTYCKDKARKFSLKKVLGTLFPNYEEKAIRRSFWEAYLHRGPSNEEKTFLRLLEKYKNSIPAQVAA